MSDPLTQPLPCPCCGRAPIVDRQCCGCRTIGCPITRIGASRIIDWNSFPRPEHPAEGLLREWVEAFTDQRNDIALDEIHDKTEYFLSSRPHLEALVWRDAAREKPTREDHTAKFIVISRMWGGRQVEWNDERGEYLSVTGGRYDDVIWFAPMPKGPGGGG